MFAKSTLLCALFAVSAQVARAQPYCLLTAVNKFEHPADQKTLCCTDASQVKSYIGDLCPAGDKTDALTAFQTACKEAGYGSCSSSSSSASGSSTASATSSGSTSASASGSSVPYPIVYTSTYFDHVCSCTKTAAISSTGVAGSTGFATGTAPIATGTAISSGVATGSGVGSGSSAVATGSPIVPVAPSKTGSAGSAGFTGAASRNFGSVAAGLLAVAGIAVAL